MMDSLKIFIVIFLLIRTVKTDVILNKFTKDFYDADALAFIKSLANSHIAVSINSITPNMNLHQILTVNYYHLGVVLDLDCLFSDLILEQFSKQLVFNETYVWLAFSSNSSATSLLTHLPLSIDAEVTLGIRRNDEFSLYDIWNPSWRHNGRFHATPKGKWSLWTGLIIELKEYKYNRRKFDMMTLNFSVALAHPPLPDLETYLRVPRDRHLDAMHRFHYSFVLLLREMFNFTMKLHTAKTWGYLRKDGTFDGILGEIVKNVIDISISPFRYRPERFDVVDFTVETLTIRTFFIFRHPSGGSLRNNFLKPFANELWWMILIVSAVYWVSLLVTYRIQKHYDGKEIVEASNAVFPVSEATLTALAALSQQGVSGGPHIISGRIIFLSLFIWGLLLFQFYSASIVGSLLTTPPRTITQLKNLTDSNIECGGEAVAWVPDMFKTTQIPEEKELYERKLKHLENTLRHPYIPLTDGMKKVQQGGFAFYSEELPVYGVIENTFHEDELCELQEIQSHPARPVTMVLRKKSPFTKMIIYGLRKIIQYGISSRIHKSWFTARPRCPETHNSKPTAVKFEQFAPAIFLLFMGTSVSVFILGIELLYYYRRPGEIEQPWSSRTTPMNPSPRINT